LSTRLAVEDGEAETEGFNPPGPSDFEFPAIFGEGTFFTKPMLIVVLGSLAVAAFYFFSARRASVVPSRLQFAGESVYSFVREQIARDSIGSHDFRPFVPYLVTLFSFILVLNISGIIPGLQFPATSKIAIPLFLAIISCLIFNLVGIRRQGLGGYFKGLAFPPGVPWPVYFLLAPIELLSTLVIRPITLTLRLALNMFAGHLVLLLAVLGGEFLLESGGLQSVLSVVPFFFAIVLTFFEGFVQVLQAYVFTLLSALYIAGALAEEH